MILRRLGNKSKIAHKIQEYFPPHSVYIELFFGAGGMFFNKPKVQYNFLNDLGYHDLSVEGILVLTNPGTHVETIQAKVRIFLVDALSRL